MEVIENDTIRLGGRVSDSQARRKALRVARERGNTPRLHDELVRTGEPVPHDELVDKVEQALSGDEVNAMVRDAEVTLACRVSSSERAQRARRNCWYLPGVHEVHNQLKITSG